MFDVKFDADLPWLILPSTYIDDSTTFVSEQVFGDVQTCGAFPHPHIEQTPLCCRVVGTT